MSKAVSQALATRRAHRDNEVRRKIEAAQLTQRASLLECNDAELVVRLGIIAERFQFHDGLSSVKRYQAALQLSDGLGILRRRVKRDGLDQHPALVPIVRALAALPSIDAGKTKAQVAALINATRENPWRALVDAPRDKPVGHLAPS